MGCWNATCGLSNLHIRAGDPVYVFVLEREQDELSLCYTTSFFRPLRVPFSSVYNDYGGGENSSGPAFGPIMQALAEEIEEMPAGQFGHIEPAVTRGGFGEEMFFDAVHDGRLYTRGKRDQIYFTMFRQDIADYILENWRQRQYRTGGSRIFGFRDVINDLDPLLDHCEENINLGGLGDIIRTGEFLDKDFNLAKLYIPSDRYNYRYSSIFDVRSAAFDLLQQGQRKQARDLLAEFIKGVHLDSYMHKTRKSWLASSHQGSQSQEHDGYLVLNRAIEQALHEEKEEFLQENDPEDFGEETDDI
jgi:hypothetical protein